MKAFIFSIAMLWLVACGSTDAVDLPTGTAATGAPLYVSNCLSCHGSDGTGGSGPDITSSSSKNIQSAVRNGPSDMPAWTESEITDQNLADIIAYIDSL
jgi:ubiquinol-cytochrome c reductase cytochrome c subunit